jgi:hypothetical protein
MPEAVYLAVRCLQSGCDMGEAKSSVGLEMTDRERLDTAESAVWFSHRFCRDKHAAGVEAVFSDDPARRILFSRAGAVWTPRDLFSSPPPAGGVR